MRTHDVEVEVEVVAEVEATPNADQLTSAVRAAVDVALSDAATPEVRALAPTGAATIGLRITTDTEMHDLNRAYRGVDRPTDVLSFSFIEAPQEPALDLPPGQPLHLGDIAISLPYAARQAVELDHPLPKELAWLTIHGTLQILGYSHATDEAAAHMESLEQAALTLVGMGPHESEAITP